MGKFKDISGNKYGRLTAIEPERNPKNGNMAWLCRCDCGNMVHSVDTYALTHGKSNSCGCARVDSLKRIFTKHGMSHKRLGFIHKGMVQRCYNPNSKKYHRYGARGIDICDEWMGENGMRSFIEWALSHGYSDDLYIDRIDNDKGYSPNNCRWVTNKENSNNRSNNRIIEINGERKTVAQWSEVYGLKSRTVERRLLLGWNEIDAVTMPLMKRGEKYGK